MVLKLPLTILAGRKASAALDNFSYNFLFVVLASEIEAK